MKPRAQRLCNFFAARVACESRAHARRPATQSKNKTPGRICFFAAWPPRTAHSLTQGGPLGRRGHPANKNTGARLCFCCAASRNRSLTHTEQKKIHKRRLFVSAGAAPEQKKKQHGFLYLRSPKDHINRRILHSGCKAQGKGDSRNHGL